MDNRTQKRDEAPGKDVSDRRPVHPHASLFERFVARLDTSGECWLWLGSMRHAYGEVIHDGRKTYAHRMAYELAYGPIPEGLIIRHVCDNPVCVRPTHLVTGTQTDNMQDCASRSRLGGNVTVTLDATRVREIRRLRAEGMKLVDIGQRFGLRANHVGLICGRHIWKWVE